MSLGPDAGLLSALYNYISTTSQPAVSTGLDMLCEVTNGKTLLPEGVCHLINTVEAMGINRYYAAPAVLILVGAIYTARVYRTIKPELDLILDLLKKEFGDESVAREIFNSFKKEIEDAADKQVQEWIGNFKTTDGAMNQKAKDEAKKKFREELIKRFMPTLVHTLKANKNTLESQAKDAILTVDEMAAQATSSLPLIPGAQNAPAQKLTPAAAKAKLSETIRENIVSPKSIVAFKKPSK